MPMTDCWRVRCFQVQQRAVRQLGVKCGMTLSKGMLQTRPFRYLGTMNTEELRKWKHTLIYYCIEKSEAIPKETVILWNCLKVGKIATEASHISSEVYGRSLWKCRNSLWKLLFPVRLNKTGTKHNMFMQTI
ncbi:hypothetical protein CDAR_165871 [Caerostris darwini]|uniref:Uncharacterized protein n=1 Tax=Caerostris darwini TaxID=1538125 RepID=A0AAV4RXA8_9ARAC|nr:hypothetical protein CDAR_165871 [Caerostris darwini]